MIKRNTIKFFIFWNLLGILVHTFGLIFFKNNRKELSMEEFKPNSHLSKRGAISEKKEESKEPEKRFEKVVKGNVTTKKKSGFRKFLDHFVSEDAQNAKNYVWYELLIPAAKKTLSEMVAGTVDILLYGETGHSRKRSSRSTISYRDYYDDRRDDRRPHYRDRDERPRRGYEFDDVMFDNRGEAEEVLTLMEEAINRYDIVTVADLYDIVGIPSKYTDNKYGWTNLSNATIGRDGDQYYIKFPKAMGID